MKFTSYHLISSHVYLLRGSHDRTLRERRLFDVDVEVILADDAMIEPYTYDWTLRVEATAL